MVQEKEVWFCNMAVSNQPEFEDRVIQIKRISKKTKGGSKFSFSALVAVGDKNGSIGVGFGKAPDVNSSIKKGISEARRNIVRIHKKDSTIAHEVRKKYKASSVLLKPAPQGSGVIAGGAIRDVVELVGIKDISAKMFGSNNKSCVVRCTVDALKLLKEVK